MASPETSDWLGPIEVTWSDSVDMPNIPIHCKYMGEWFVLKSIAHGSKCPIEFWLPIDVGQKFSWFMKTCSEFSLPLQDAANEVVQICIFLLPKIVNCERAQAQSWLEAYSWMGRPSLQRIPTFPWQLGNLWKFSPCQATEWWTYFDDVEEESEADHAWVWFPTQQGRWRRYRHSVCWARDQCQDGASRTGKEMAFRSDKASAKRCGCWSNCSPKIRGSDTNLQVLRRSLTFDTLGDRSGACWVHRRVVSGITTRDRTGRTQKADTTRRQLRSRPKQNPQMFSPKEQWQLVISEKISPKTRKPTERWISWGC